ncbi:MAG: transposase [Akkermansiaceae bacterium]|nr:transposase [Akkermansiaceae bacterium]
MRGIYDRGYLPHWDFDGAVQAVTFRLADAMPVGLVRGWKEELASLADDRIRNKELRRRIARYEDTGCGEALLKDPGCAGIVQDKLIAGHESRYLLIDWCIMPNHVHVLLRLLGNQALADIARLWKGSSAFGINRLIGRSGALWQREYYDRYVRDLEHFHDCRAYIRNNLVKANLCEKPQGWRFSSAGMNWEERRF